MSKDAVFTMKLEPELRAQFLAEAERQDRPASQVIRELMRDYLEKCREERAYNDYLQQKVEAGRASMHAARGRSNDDVERDFAARRGRVDAHPA